MKLFEVHLSNQFICSNENINAEKITIGNILN